MNKQQLASRIWESANKMRSTIEASQYKDYILGFIFYRFLSETLKTRLFACDFTEADLERLTEDDPETVAFVQSECGYFISCEHLFSSWIKKGADFGISDVRGALSAFERNIAPAHKKVFEGIFDTLQTGLSRLGSDARSQSRAARDLIYLIRGIPIDGRAGYDVLGYIYEYLLSNFAANAGKKAGEFYTPHEVSALMSELVATHLSGREKIEIYDPTSGSGSLLINIGKAVARKNGNPDAIRYFAQELKENTYNLTRMNLVMRGILPDNIVVRNGDTLEDDWPWFDSLENKEETYEPLFVDAVVSNPPYSQNWEPEGKENDVRFGYGLAPRSKADYAFLLHDLYHLRPDGIMCIVLPHGVLFRGGEEGTIRKNLVEQGHIRAIIGLPANIFFGTGIPTIIMVLGKQQENPGAPVLVVDASRHFIKDGKNNRLRSSDIRRIVDTFAGSSTIPGYSRAVPIDEIRANAYNLNIPRYVDSTDAPESWDIHASMFGGVPESELAALDAYWSAWPALKEELFSQAAGPCLTPRFNDRADIAKAIAANKDVQAFTASFKARIEPLAQGLAKRLVATPENVDPFSEEERTAEALFEAVSHFPLVDAYGAYQILDDVWQTIAGDLETIHTEGICSIRAVDARLVPRKKAGSDIEVQDGWQGRILSFDLVQRLLMPEELKALASTEERISAISRELGSILEEMDEADKSGSGAVSEDGSSFVPAALKRGVRAIGKNPGSPFERSLLSAQALMDEEKELKAHLKKDRAALEEKTRTLIQNLDACQIKDLLYAKWIEPLSEGLAALPAAVVDSFTSKVQALCAKYSTTYEDVCSEIEQTEKELASMLDKLCGSEADMAGIAALKKLLGGE